jgi:isoquinoline 1-oxidoreductase beta subunit
MKPALRTLSVNGMPREIDVKDTARPLVWYLRDRLGLKGTKFGCGHGACGACTVQVDGRPVHSCTVTVEEVAGRDVTTIEGLAQRPDHPVLRAWLAEQVPQCGYCQPAMVMTAAALLARMPDPSDDAIDAALGGVLCRCGSYQRVRAAVHLAARQQWERAPFAAAALPPASAPPQRPYYRFNPWVTIASDGAIIVTIERSEMGQGITTALSMLVAEELDVPLERIRTEFAPVDRAYDNPVIGMQITVGSMSMMNAWLRVRQAGADARERLRSAGAKTWRDYGTAAPAAAALPPVASPPLKPREQYALLGKPTARIEIPDHIAGRSTFGMDVTLPGMLAATVILPPAFRATAVKFDASAAASVDGFREAFPLGDGVAVVADDLWAAFRAREAIPVTWSEGDASLSTQSIRSRLLAALERTGTVERETGDALGVLFRAPATYEAVYETPYEAHVPIEPINCTAHIHDGICEVWAPTQGQTLAQQAAAQAAGMPLEAVRIHTTYIGGGFGRRSVPDYVVQAVAIAKRIRAPVQLVWTRADDIRHDRYRPANAVSLRAALDASNVPVALFVRIAGPKLAFEGVDVPYDIPNLRVECVEEDPGLPTGYWRSVGASQNAFAIESFIDELARRAGADPVRYRLQLLRSSPRHRAVLELAAEKAGWGYPSGGRAQGVALYAAHGGWVTHIVEISVRDERIAAHRVVCAVDCGFVVNPDTVAAQIEGAVAFGLSAAIKSSVTIERGRVMQGGFRDYPLPTISEMPRVDVHVVPSTQQPTGAGECGVPPVAPAVANALFAATGERVRSIPLRVSRKVLNQGVR